MTNSIDKTIWQTKGQEGEFSFHKKNIWRQTPKFMEQTTKLFEYFGFSKDQFAHQTIIDLGCGSKLRTKYFQKSRIIGIEPLADRFNQEIVWSDLNDCFKLYSFPAEHYIEECFKIADLVISINVLDHCFNFKKIIDNIAKYTKLNGKVFLSFDKHNEVDDLHPLALDEEFCEETFEKAGLVVVDCLKGFGGAIPENTYGHGPYALNYHLTLKKS